MPTPLRRTVTPYIGEVIIFTAVTIFLIWVAATKQQWQMLWGPAVLWLLYALYVYFFQLKYRILFDDSGLIMRASGGNRRISFSEISDIRYEVAQVSEFATQSRPFRRIVICGSRHAEDNFIDISLRHFQIEDIKALLKIIHTHKPDLEIPVIPYVTASSTQQAR